jgi:hypothetical protein
LYRVEQKRTQCVKIQPSAEEFAKVRALHQEVKQEKDKEARDRGFPKSSVQAYSTLQQKWKHWTFWTAVYKEMNPEMSLQTLFDLMKYELKQCASVSAVEDVLKNSIMRHIAKLKREARKLWEQESVSAELEALHEEEKKAEDNLQLVQAAEADVVEEKRELESQYNSTRGQQRAQEGLEMDAILEKEKSIVEEKKAALKTKKELDEKKQALSKRKKIIERILPTDKLNKKTNKLVKRAKHNDPLLLNEAPTPQKVAEMDGVDMKPPTCLECGKFEDPGPQWHQENVWDVSSGEACLRCVGK